MATERELREQPIEVFTFNGGIITKRDPIFLKDGELVSCEGFVFTRDGIVESRKAKTVVNTTQATSTIDNIHRYINWVFLTEGNNIRHKWDMNGFCNLYTPPDDEFTLSGRTERTGKVNIVDYDDFIFYINSSVRKAFTRGYLYDMKIPNPDTAPGVTYQTNSKAGYEGIYDFCYTFLIKFPNGKIYESAPSPTLSKSAIGTRSQANWTNVKTCPYTGQGVIIWRNLYTKRSTWGEYHLTDSIKNNTDTSYEDITAFATIPENPALSSQDVGSMPDIVNDVELYLQRLFFINDNKLYWTEAYKPLAVKSTSNIAVSPSGVELVCVRQWGDQLYTASKEEWYRLSGTSPTDWAIKRTFASSGIINKNTVRKTRYGLIGQWFDGIYAFDGFYNKNLTVNLIGKTLFEDTISDLDACYSTFDGEGYYFYYPTSGSTLNKCLVLDFSTWPVIRAYNEDFIPTSFEFDMHHNIKYFGYDGYQYQESGTETIATTLKSGNRIFKNIFKRKNLEYLYYDIDTDDVDATVNIYCDDTLAQTFTLNNSARTRDRLPLKNIEGYKFAIEVACTNSQNLKIYAPWALLGTLVGD